jgi:hypothetical protein
MQSSFDFSPLSTTYSTYPFFFILDYIFIRYYNCCPYINSGETKSKLYNFKKWEIRGSSSQKARLPLEMSNLGLEVT